MTKPATFTQTGRSWPEYFEATRTREKKMTRLDLALRGLVVLIMIRIAWAIKPLW